MGGIALMEELDDTEDAEIDEEQPLVAAKNAKATNSKTRRFMLRCNLVLLTILRVVNLCILIVAVVVALKLYSSGGSLYTQVSNQVSQRADEFREMASSLATKTSCLIEEMRQPLKENVEFVREIKEYLAEPEEMPQLWEDTKRAVKTAGTTMKAADVSQMISAWKPDPSNWGFVKRVRGWWPGGEQPPASAPVADADSGLVEPTYRRRLALEPEL